MCFPQMWSTHCPLVQGGRRERRFKGQKICQVVLRGQRRIQEKLSEIYIRPLGSSLKVAGVRQIIKEPLWGN